MLSLNNLHHNPFLVEVNQRSGSNVLDCYQCGKCVGTCPVSGQMQITPRQVMQHVKLGLKNQLFEANSTWFCLNCSACSSRCPREIEIPKVMEAVRHLAIEAKVYPEATEVTEIRLFHEIFLEMIQKYGKMFELRLMAEYNLRSGKLFKDIALAPKAILKGKLPFFPEKTKNKRAMDRLFKIAKELDEKQE